MSLTEYSFLCLLTHFRSKFSQPSISSSRSHPRTCWPPNKLPCNSMGQPPLNKGNQHLVQTPSQNSLASQSRLSLLGAPVPEASANNHVLSFRRTSSRVWSDIRGAIKAIGRSSNSSRKQMDFPAPNSRGSDEFSWTQGGDSPRP